MKTRLRNVKDKKEMERMVDDFITMGYTISEQGEKSVKMIYKKYGGIGSHIIILILFCWTFLIANVLWLVYNYFVNSEEVIIRIEE
ncbi:MAG: hypothetical protein MJ232_04270 [archaeon]|nr:hypothetical protein [archaeon]